MTSNEYETGVVRNPSAGLADYLAIARFDHITKHIFILPGLISALMLRNPSFDDAVLNIILGMISAITIASANYTINEWLDREYDKYHPTKSARRSVVAALDVRYVYLQYFLLCLIGIVAAIAVNHLFLIAALTFILSGLVYNVRPARVKDRTYFDVLFESLNNPIRFLLGWAMLVPDYLPPSSLMLAYWMGGAFLMGSKRLSEYRQISASAGVETLHMYRRSFRGYTVEKLTVSCFVYSLLCCSLLSIFLIKYRIEYALAFPFLVLMFAKYLSLSFMPDSTAQKPEHLFREFGLMTYCIITVLAFTLLTFIDVPILDGLSEPHLIQI